MPGAMPWLMLDVKIWRMYLNMIFVRFLLMDVLSDPLCHTGCCDATN